MILGYEDLTDDELLDKMAEIDWDTYTIEKQLVDLRNLYNQTQQIQIQKERQPGLFLVKRPIHKGR